MVKKKKIVAARWSKAELRLLKRLFPQKKAKEVAEKTGRPLTAVRQKAYSIGLGTRENRLWTPEEHKILKKLYHIEGPEKLAERLGRTREAIMARAVTIGVRKTKPRSPDWTKKEEDLLRKLYKDPKNTKEDIAKQVGRTAIAVGGRAFILGLRRKNPPWSKKELALLRKVYLTHEDKEISAMIGRTPGAVAIRRYKMGLMKH